MIAIILSVGTLEKHKAASWLGGGFVYCEDGNRIVFSGRAASSSMNMAKGHWANWLS